MAKVLAVLTGTLACALPFASAEAMTRQTHRYYKAPAPVYVPVKPKPAIYAPVSKGPAARPLPTISGRPLMETPRGVAKPDVRVGNTPQQVTAGIYQQQTVKPQSVGPQSIGQPPFGQPGIGVQPNPTAPYDPLANQRRYEIEEWNRRVDQYERDKLLARSMGKPEPGVPIGLIGAPPMGAGPLDPPAKTVVPPLYPAKPFGL